MGNIFNPDFTEYIGLLNKHNVEYMLVGGMAVNIHGYRRSTGDMDLFVNPTSDNHLRIQRVHQDFGMFMGEMESLKNFLDLAKYDVYTFGVSPVQIDIMTACKGVDFDSAFTNSSIVNIDDGLEIRVIHFDQLIEAKVASNRTRDKADIEELKRIRGNI